MLKMTKSDQYYFTDSIFQLELNLHNIRRELILMIEQFEREDCSKCLQLKCRCTVKSQEANSKARSDGTNSNDGTPSKAPPADLLPKPKFDIEEASTVSKEGIKDIEAWIQASRTERAMKTDKRIPTDVLLASFKKSWGDYRNEVKKDIIVDDYKKGRNILETRFSAASAVEVFFNRFKVQPAATASDVAFITNVAAVYAQQKTRASEYSYF